VQRRSSAQGIVVRACATALAALASLIAGTASAEEVSPFHEAALDVVLNALPKGPVLIVLLNESGDVWVSEQDLRLMRLVVPATQPHRYQSTRYYALADIEGLHLSVDESRQRLIIDAPSSAFAETNIDVTDRPHPVAMSASPGAFLNYEFYGQHADQRSGGTFAELGVFGPAGVLTSTALARADDASARGLRLDTTFTRDLPDRLVTWSLGDAISDGGHYANSVRFAGFRMSRNYALRPDLLTLPLPSATGGLSVPSTVDILINGQLASRQDLPPGPFTIDRVPTVTGSGEISVVVRDALGREQTTTRSFYASTDLLARGLTEYAVDVGPIRMDYAIESNHYGALIAQGTWRRGLTDTVTFETHAEYEAGDIHNAGLSLALGAGRFGVMTLTAATGGDASAEGQLGGLGFERRGRRFSFVASGSWADKDYRQIGDGPVGGGQVGEGTVGNSGIGARFRSRMLVQSGLSLGAGSTLAFAVARQTYDTMATQQVFTATYGIRLGASGMLHIAATQFRGTENSTAGFVTFTLPLSGNRTFSAAAMRDSASGPGEALGTLIRNPDAGVGSGYRLSASSSGDYEARWQKRSDVMDLALESRAFDGTRTESLWLSGALTLLGGEWSTVRSAGGSFAVVDAAGISGVPIYLENQHVATTGASGRALVGNLRPYEPNHVGVQPRDLPLDTSVEAREITVTPPYRSGVLVRLPLQRVRAGVFRLRRSNGEPVPAGASVEFNGKRFPVVLDGFVYVTNFDHGLSAVAKWDGGWCRFRIEPPPAGDPMPDMGTLSCHDQPMPPPQRRSELDADHEVR
jgi:outer membrane usher protein